MAKFSYGSRVKHRTYKWLKDAGTVIAIQPELWPFVTESASIPARYKVEWDEHGVSGWLSESELVGA